MKFFLIPLLILSGLVNGQNAEDTLIDSSQNVPAPDPFVLKYDLDRPDRTLNMPSKLIEISGLSLSPYHTMLCAVQDEDGKIFFLDKKSGLVKEEINFWKSGDYEGVEVVGDDVFVVKSSGTIYEVRKIATKRQEVIKYNSFLGKQNNVEGLCYDARKHRLLLACKGTPATGESFKDLRFKKVIYGFDLKTKQLDSLPAYTIELKNFQNVIEKLSGSEKQEKLKEMFSQESNGLNFNPSSIAIHPLSGNLYLTSSIGKVLMVISPEGVLLHLEKMDKKIHPQPEGITFDPDGTMYISNEGKKSMAKIHCYKMNN